MKNKSLQLLLGHSAVIRSLCYFSFLVSLPMPMAAAEFEPPLETSDGFAVPQPEHDFEFPRDHGSHPEFKIEWWYVTGHLFGDEGRRFGFQATFFRRAGPRAEDGAILNTPSESFDSSELHLAHMALLDVKEKRFLHEERLNRRGWDAGSSTNSLSVRNGNWSLNMSTNNNNAMSLQGSIRSDAALTLQLIPAKPLVVFGENGVSRKGASPTAASYYLTFPRLNVTGTVKIDGEERVVTGQAWMDHEISSSQLDDDQSGWDWASLQLNDGREIMAYRLRKLDGSMDPFSQLAWVDKLGDVTRVTSKQFTWSGKGAWKSPRSGGEYPVHVELAANDPATGKLTTFALEPLFLEQELRGALGGVSYWEGACRVLDERDQDVGSAYLELAGYVGRLTDRFK